MNMAIRILFTTYCLLGLALPAAAAPSVIARDDSLWIEGSMGSFHIPFAALTDNDTVTGQVFIDVARQPSFGTIGFGFGKLIYTPGNGFRDFGHDSFTYSIRAKSGQSQEAQVHLYMQIPSVLVASQGFEPGEPVNYSIPYASSPTSPIEFGISGALDGVRGVIIDVPAGQTQPHYLAFPVDFADNNDDGRTTLLGCGDGGIIGGAAAVITLSNIGDDVNTSPVRVFFTEDTNGEPALVAEVRKEDETGYTSSPLLPYTSDVIDISLQWSPDGVILSANGISVTHTTPVSIDDGPFEVRIGVMPVSALSEPGTFGFDLHKVYKKAATPPPFPEIFHDHFENPFQTWTDAYGSGLNGWGHNAFYSIAAKSFLQVDLGAGDSFLVDATPDHEELFHGQFFVDVEDFVHLPSPIEIYELGNTADPIFDEDPHVSVRVRRDLHIPQISIVARTAAGETASPWVSLSGRHHVAIKARVSMSNTMPVGYVHLFVDGQPAERLINLGNQGAEVDWVRLGALSVAPTADAILTFEAYESWR